MSDFSTNLGSSIHDDIRDTRNTVMVAITGFTVLLWDHFITFDDEVELVWKRDKGLLVYLFLLNRYLTPLGFIVNLVASTLPSWGAKHFVRYEGAMTIIGTQVAGLIMFLRVRALYNDNRIVIWGVFLLFLAWLGINALLLTNGEGPSFAVSQAYFGATAAVQHISGVHSCSMIFNGSLSKIASASAWLPLLYDSCIFALTLCKTIRETGYLIQRLLSDGILYYSVICTVNIVLTIMIVRAGQGVRNIAAQLELLFTVAMVSRITLNLRRQTSEDNVFVISPPSRPPRTLRAELEPAGARSRANTAGSTAPPDDSITFRRGRVSQHELVRLSVINSVDLRSEAMTPATVNSVGASSPRFERSGVEGEV